MATERFIPFEARYGWERALEAVTHMLGHTWGSAHANTLTTATAVPLRIFPASSSIPTLAACAAPALATWTSA